MNSGLDGGMAYQGNDRIETALSSVVDIQKDYCIQNLDRRRNRTSLQSEKQLIDTLLRKR